MTWLEKVRRRLRILFRKEHVESELAEEVRLHLDMEAEELVRHGWDPADARREAHRRFGGVERAKEWVRDERGGRLLDDLFQDIRYAQRSLRKSPGFTMTAVLVLALGIGANTALFSAVKGLLLDTIPVADPEGLVRLGWTGQLEGRTRRYGYWTTAAGERVRETFSDRMFEQLSTRNDTLSGMFASVPSGQLNVIVDGHAEIASGFMASGGYFDVLGVVPLLGRAIGPDDDHPAASPVAMISHAFWARRFGLDPDVVGRVITINTVAATIVGVLPPEYTGVQRPLDDAADLHLPLALYPQFGDEAQWQLGGAVTWLQIMGRVKPGVTAEQVHGNLDGPFQAAVRAGRAEPRSMSLTRNRTAEPRLLVDSGSRGVYDPNPDSTRQAMMLGVVVVLVLLIVCANVANLLLSRATTRQREIAVRLSMGATRGRLVRQLVTESMVLSTIGGGLGVLVAVAARRLLPFGQTAPFDWRVFAFVAVLSVSAALVFGFVPALRATGVGLSSSLKASSHSVARSRTVLGKALIVVQVAVSLVLVVGAGLFLKTLGNLRNVEVGFNPANILLFRVDPGLNGYDDDRQAVLYDQLTQSIRSVPGVQSVSLSEIPLLGGHSFFFSVSLAGREAADKDDSAVRTVSSMTVSPEFFETMEIPLLAGRTFDARDSKDAPQVAVINDAAAKAFFGTARPLGRRFGFSPETRGAIEIVGVVRDVKSEAVRAAPRPTVYQSHLQSDVPAFLFGWMFAVRTAGLPGPLTPAVREAVHRVDPNLPLMDVLTQAEQIEEGFAQERLFALAYSLFGGLAMVLAATGLLGVMSYAVAQRTNEIGIRMALGADKANVRRMVLGESLVPVCVGVGVGIGGVFVTGRLVASLLFELAPTDGATIVQAVAMLVVVAALAAYLPARRAAGVDPLIALRCE